MAYTVVLGNTPAELSAEVAKLLIEGWEPLGGVSMSVWPEQMYIGHGESLDGRGMRFAQALVRPDDA